jgi:hypothetical protein
MGAGEGSRTPSLRFTKQRRSVPFRQRVLLAVLLADHPSPTSLPLSQPTPPIFGLEVWLEAFIIGR